MKHKFHCVATTQLFIDFFGHIFFSFLKFKFNDLVKIEGTTTALKMNLPPEIITYILGYLDIKNLLKCRLVSKYFKSLIAKIPISPLAICQELSRSRNDNFFCSGTPISSSYFINKVNLSMFEGVSFMRIISRTKKAYIDCSVIRVACINEEWFLNEFKQIQQLQVISLNQSTDDGFFSLSLSNLEILLVSSINLYKMRLDCPKLKAFSTTDSLSKYTFTHPETVKYLDIFKFESCMQDFVNLERASIEIGNTVDPDILNSCGNLKELRFERRMRNEILNELIKRKKFSKTRPELYYLGEKIREKESLQ